MENLEALQCFARFDLFPNDILTKISTIESYLGSRPTKHGSMSSAPDSHDWIPCHEQNRLYTFGIVCRNQDISGEVDSKALASLTPLGPIISSTRLSSQIGIRTKQFTQRSTFDLFFSLSSVIKTREIYWPYFVTNTRFQVNLHTPWNIAHLLSILDFIEVYTGLYPIMHHFSIRRVEMQTIHAAAVGGPSHDNALK